MRIGIEASTWINRRGYGRFTRELTRALLRSPGSHRYTLILDRGAAGAPDLPDADRIVVETSEAVTEAAAHGSARRPVDLARMSWTLSRRRFDWVVFPTVYSFVPIVGRARVAVVIHDALPEMYSKLVLGSRVDAALWRAKTWLAVRQASVLATVSTAAAADIRQHVALGSRTLAVLTEGVSPLFSAAPRPDDAARVRAVAPDGRLVVFVGGVSPHKRIPELVDAFGRVAADRPGLRLVLAGPLAEDRFSADEARVREAVAALGVRSATVHRTGYVPDETLAALYRAATCVVLPSMAEGFGLPALEAMACGAPVLAARTPALVELCDGAAEFFDEVSELPDALRRVIDSDTRRAALRAAGPARAAAFGWDEAARRLMTALECC